MVRHFSRADGLTSQNSISDQFVSKSAILGVLRADVNTDGAVSGGVKVQIDASDETPEVRTQFLH